VISVVGQGKRSKMKAVAGSPGAPSSLRGSATATAALTSISPSTLAHTVRKIMLTATGTGFKPGCTIYQGTKALPTQYISRTQVRTSYFVPAPAGTLNVAVRNPGEAATATRPFTVT
jgi:hypothetical protein